MKLQQLQEARYHGAPTVEEVHAKLTKLIYPSTGDVQVLEVEERNGKSVYAEIRIWVYDKNDVVRAIKKFMDKHNIPGEYGNIENVHRYDWRANIMWTPN